MCLEKTRGIAGVSEDLSLVGGFGGEGGNGIGYGCFGTHGKKKVFVEKWDGREI